MKTKLKKLICVLLSLTVIFCTVSAYADEEAQDSTTTAPQTSTTVTTTKKATTESTTDKKKAKDKAQKTLEQQRTQLEKLMKENKRKENH